MTRRGVWLGMLMAAGLSAVTACGNPSNAVRVAMHEGTIADERIVVNSWFFGHRLRFGEVLSRREGMLTHVQVAMENTTRNPIDFEYRWEWSDADGFQLGDTMSSWNPSVVNGKERKMLTGVGPGPSAVNFRLHVRKPD